MIIHAISLNSLAKIVPDEVDKFKEVCKINKISVKNAIRDLAQGESDLDPLSLEAIRTVFKRMSDAFTAKTVSGVYQLKLEAVYNDDELEGAGALIRVYGSVVLSPAAAKIKKLLAKKDITVHKPKKEWDLERFDTGL